ncbi:SoxR reducing system RseC family protein [Oscillospiraceae bacterium CM]|nr:SoxR reducing system RseC family protein [Oscillospiraceae bacterium CM]
MKTSVGIVIETDGKTATVKAGRHTECESCGACSGNNAPLVTVRNPVGAHIGQRVEFEVQEESSLKGAFLIFVLPLAAAFLGVWLGGLAAVALGWKMLIGNIAGGAVLFFASIVAIRVSEKKISRSLSSLPAILKIVK